MTSAEQHRERATALEAIATIARARARTLEDLARATAGLRSAIEDAREVGCTVADIARAAALSRQRIEQILAR